MNNFAQCQKMKYKFFAAEREKQGFINLLKGTEQTEVAKKAWVSLVPVNQVQNNNFNYHNIFGINNRNLDSGRYNQSLFTMKKAV